MNTARLRRHALISLAGLFVLAPLAALAQSGCALLINLGDPPQESTGTTGTGTTGGAPTAEGDAGDASLPNELLCIAEEQDQPRALAVADEVVFWENEGDQTLWRVDLRGDAKPTRMLTTAPQVIHSLAVDIEHVYWSAIENIQGCIGKASVGRVLRSAKDGKLETIWHAQDSCHTPESVFVDGTNLYWTISTFESNVAQMSKGQLGGTPQVLTSTAQPTSVWVDSTDVYWVERPYDHIVGSVNTASTVDFTFSKLRKIADDGDGVQITGDAENIYWVTSSGKVRTLPKKGNATARSLVEGIGAITSLSIDERYIYYSVPGANEIRRVLISGGTPEVVVTKQNDPQRVVVDAKRLYWTSLAGRKVCMMAKP